MASGKLEIYCLSIYMPLSRTVANQTYGLGRPAKVSPFKSAQCVVYKSALLSAVFYYSVFYDSFIYDCHLSYSTRAEATIKISKLITFLVSIPSRKLSSSEIHKFQGLPNMARKRFDIPLMLIRRRVSGGKRQ
jgi:hypothetical protein